MKSVIAFITAALFSMTAFAQAPAAKKEEKKVDAKPAATAPAKDAKPASAPAAKKEEAKK